MILFISKDKLLNFPILKRAFMLYNIVYLSDESFLTYAISLLGICMCVCVMYMPLCGCLLLVLTEQMTSLRTLSFGKVGLISPASLIWSLERPLGFRISEKTKKNNLMRLKHIIKYKTHSLPPFFPLPLLNHNPVI